MLKGEEGLESVGWIGVKEVLARKGLLTSKKRKLTCKIGMNGAVYVGGCDMPLASLQQDV